MNCIWKSALTSAGAASATAAYLCRRLAQIAGSALGDAGLCRKAEVFAADVLRGVNPAEAVIKGQNRYLAV